MGLVALTMTVPGADVQALENQDQSACPNGAAALPAELAAWPDRTGLKAGTDFSKLGGARIAPGHAIDAGLSPTPDIRYAFRPEKPGGSVSFGGLYALNIKEPGTYRIALGSAAWIDLAHGGKAVPSSAHGHGPDCSGIRKMVDFALTPGRYVLQISANASNSMPLLVTRLP
ncbi:hypothetical protein SAMN05518801_12216 [Novosphingobium sp. CF614]|uniref:homogentisate 1,2-dioxygenase n=1 Tax=Novosphingobium sp. CF614 TaxID=1884364 RepID=UPI0008E3242B|nr:homogentisate 1,2-dioxygenase [Novosphingobium sp. CF614]SFG39673.1 hypothetical protein SAMN05518801_12216 [Novosphingobium sp. CF614]